MKKEALSNSTPKIKYALAEKYDKESKDQYQKEVDGYERLKSKESTKLPFQVGSYLGKKKVLGIGAGFYAHPNAMVNLNTGEHESVSHFAVDAFLDMPLSNDDCLNAYASFSSFNYGENFVSRWAGSGSVIYTQAGYRFPRSKFMPYVAAQIADYDGFTETINAIDIGVNYFILGHNAKLTLEYHKITNDIREGAITNFDDNNSLSQLRLQAHVFL